VVFVAIQIDTKDILFICGGAFIDLEKTISERYLLFLPTWKLLSVAFSGSLHLRCIPLHFLVNRRQDSSIGFGAPVRASMRAGGISSAQVTSSLLESVCTMSSGARYFGNLCFRENANLFIL
jgi:ATP-dependent Clp protease ATP-binding subunit ClpX